MFRRLAICCVLCGLLGATNAQTSLTSPFDFPLLLSGSFAELRSGHFHGGLDFKTQGVTGKPVHCVAQGYVSRVTVSESGYGQAIYVTHPNGLVSVYGHVESFMEDVAQRVEQYQFANQCYEVDLTFQPTDFPVANGAIIARSGNEGYSFGPHLHFELRRADTGQYVDPLPYFQSRIVDTMPPRALAIYVYDSDVRRVNVAELSNPIPAWGETKLGIEAFDYMNQTQNRYGVYRVRLYQDTTLLFSSETPAYHPDENPMVNGWIDYSELAAHRHWVMRSHLQPGCQISILQSGWSQGKVMISEAKDYHFRYELTDRYGNRSVYPFVLRGTPSRGNVMAPIPSQAKMLGWNQLGWLQEQGMEILFMPGSFFDDVASCMSVRLGDTLGVSHVYQLHDAAIPLRQACDLSIKVIRKPVADERKYYIASCQGRKLQYVGGTMADGWVTAPIQALGTYVVAVDTVAPELMPVNRQEWAQGKVCFKIADQETRIRSYRVEVDGRFWVFAYNRLRGTLQMRYPQRLKRGVRHRLYVEVIDVCGNVTHQDFVF